MKSIRSSSGGMAFTLIELLTVICIVAILAALLFPVLASVLEKSRNAQCESNLRQMGTAFQSYLTDFDETTPHMQEAVVAGGIDGSGYVPKWYGPLEAYISSQQVLVCPDRLTRFDPSGDGAGQSAGSDPGRCYDNWNTTGYCFGYGYNDGIVSDAGYGLIQSYVSKPVKIRAGRNVSQIALPAETFVFGDTYDRPGYSIAADNIMSTLATGASTSTLRHSGRLNMSFFDGHVASIPYRLANYPGFGLIGLPQAESDAYDYCYDRSSAFVPTPGSRLPSDSLPASYPLQSANETCSQAVTDVYTNSIPIP